MMDEGNAESRLHFLSELLDTFSESCYIWHYDADGSLMETNCADLVLDKVFRRRKATVICWITPGKTMHR